MRELIIFGFLLVSASCATAQVAEKPRVSPSPTPPAAIEIQTADSSAETVTVGNYTLTLNDCRLEYQNAEKTSSYSFPFAAPCQFSKDENGKIRLFKVKKTTVVAVESSRPKLDPATGADSKDCETQVRGVIVGKNSIKLSAQTQKVAMCLPFVWDEKMFTMFGAKTEPMPE